MSDNLAKIEALVPDFQYVDSDHNRVVLTAGFSASFYFWDGHTSAKREALIECVEAFEAAAERLDEAAKAHAHLEAGEHVGKVVLTVG